MGKFVNYGTLPALLYECCSPPGFNDVQRSIEYLVREGALQPTTHSLTPLGSVMALPGVETVPAARALQLAVRLGVAADAAVLFAASTCDVFCEPVLSADDDAALAEQQRKAVKARLARVYFANGTGSAPMAALNLLHASLSKKWQRSHWRRAVRGDRLETVAKLAANIASHLLALLRDGQAGAAIAEADRQTERELKCLIKGKTCWRPQAEAETEAQRMHDHE